MRKAPMMTGRSRLPGPFAGIQSSAIGAILLAVFLAGCGTTMPPGIEPIDYTAAPRDLVPVVSVADGHVVRLGGTGHVDKLERIRLDAFIADVAANRPESLRVAVHGLATPAQF